jgi:predicted TIM-barrel fold metal-dependent hydrolase
MRCAYRMALALVAGAAGCAKPRPVPKPPVPAFVPSPIPKFDVHTHIGPDGMARALEVLVPNGVVGAVNLSGGDEPGLLAHQLREAEAGQGRVLVFANLDFQQALAPGWVERQVAWLHEAKRMGARGLKIFKTLGLWVHDPAGNRVAVDDPRLDPIFAAAGELGMPVAIHVGDPKAFFEPVTRDNERYQELALNPGWSFADRGRYPPWETLFQEFQNLVARHPRTTFIGVHFGNDPEEPARVAALMDRLPNLVVDTAARVGEIGRTPPEQLRQIFLDHRTRILFGTDIGVSANDLTLGCPEGYPETPETTARFFRAHWEFFETDRRGLAHPSSIQGNWTVDGIDLPREVLEDFYHRNAERLFGLAPLPQTP